MEPRKFAIGDRVRLLLGNHANDNPTGVYTVSRALPAMANVWQYRVTRIDDGQERAVSEPQLAKAGFRNSTNLSVVEA
jgi:hypothetical protein